MTGFIIGLLVGGALGVALMAMLQIARDDDKEDKK